MPVFPRPTGLMQAANRVLEVPSESIAARLIRISRAMVAAPDLPVP
jgi:hypothetical protein